MNLCQAKSEGEYTVGEEISVEAAFIGRNHLMG